MTHHMEIGMITVCLIPVLHSVTTLLATPVQCSPIKQLCHEFRIFEQLSTLYGFVTQTCFNEVCLINWVKGHIIHFRY